MKIEGDPKAIASAFVKARAAMSATVPKDGAGVYGSYATLAAIMEAISNALSANGLAMVQEAELDEKGVTIATWLVHESGSTMEFVPLTMPLANRTAQAVGSAITYGRRYQLASVCGLAPNDDDGEEATTGKPATKPAQTAHKPQETRQAQHRGNETAKAQTTPQRAPVSPTQDVDMGMGQKPTESPPHQRLWGCGMAVFGPDWDMARPWLISQWTRKVTPDNARNSASELTDDEKTMLGDYLNEAASKLQKIWPNQRAMMQQATAQPVQP